MEQRWGERGSRSPDIGRFKEAVIDVYHEYGLALAPRQPEDFVVVENSAAQERYVWDAGDEVTSKEEKR